MSKDIRSFFKPKKPATPAVVIDDDDDVIPESPDVQIKNKKKPSKKKRYLSDSDDEIFASKKKKSDHESQKPSQKKKTPDKPLQEVKAVDIFGSGPIKRSEPLVIKEREKKIPKNTETGIHSDEEFERSLLEVDALEELSTKDIKQEKSLSKSHSETSESKKKELKETSSRKVNGDSHSQEKKDEKKDKSHRSKESTHSESKKDKHSKSDASTSKKEKGSDVLSLFPERKDKKEVHSEKDKSKKLNAGHAEMKIKENGEGTSKDVSSHDKKDKKEIQSEEDKLKKLDTSHEDLKITENGEVTFKDKKRDFSEFLDNNVSVSEDHDDDKHKRKKKKLDTSLNDSALTDEERHERKMYSAALYKSYLNRSGPKHLGAKEIPEGAPDCLANCAFLLTGVLDSFERDEIAAAITKYGGCVKSGISKKVTHVLAGDDAGPAKMAKAQELGIKILNEEEFLQLIIDSTKKPSKKDVKKEHKKEKSPSRKTPKKSPQDKRFEREKQDRKSAKDRERKPSSDKLDVKTESKNHVRNKSQESSKSDVSKSKSPGRVNHQKPVEITKDIKLEEAKSTSSIKSDVVVASTSQPHAASSTSSILSKSIMWVEKYKPQNVKQIIGQHGDASNVKKLMNWLTKWYVNRKAKLPKPSPWAKNDDGGFYKAALLSGPPGVGKTTTVALVCKELGFDMVEFNASDTRNKTLIKEQIGELLTTTSLSAYAYGSTGKQAVTKKHVLVMDEVDGMAGNEDRGGLQELIGLIKSTSVPIICMCNDRNSQKMRSLVNYCYDLRFNRPRVEQIKSAMMSICCKEGIKVPPDALTQLIIAANQDVRQTLNLLSMWAVDPNLMDSDKLKKDAQSGKKDIKLGPWEAVRKVFSAEEHKSMSINDMSDLFFYDYSLAPLFVHENYLHVAPHCPKNEVLSRLAKAADSISMGDLVDARIRGNQAWNLLPMQAMYSSVIPGHEMSGHMAGQINFPGWLGNNSKANKMHRLCQEIHAHTRLSTSGSKSSIFLDYSSHLRDAIVTPLLKDKADGIEKSLEVLESYHLLREDLDSLVELSLWSGQRNPMILIDSKIKAAMTRTYNKKALALPYAPGSFKKGRARENEDGEGEEYDNEDEKQDSDPESDALIKKKKVKEEKPGTSKEKAGSSKDQARPGTSKERPGSKEKPSTSRKKK